MLETKMFEIRDAATYIPVLAIKLAPAASSTIRGASIDAYHLRHTGYGLDDPLIALMRLEPPMRAEYDPYAWDPGSAIRTMREAHIYIRRHFDELEYGAVIDVEYILGIKPEPKKSQRFGESTDYAD